MSFSNAPQKPILKELSDFSETHYNSISCQLPVIRHEWFIDNSHNRLVVTSPSVHIIGFTFFFRPDTLRQWRLECRTTDTNSKIDVYLKRVSGGGEHRLNFQLSSVGKDVLGNEIHEKNMIDNFTFTSVNQEVRIAQLSERVKYGPYIRLTLEVMVYPDRFLTPYGVTTKSTWTSPVVCQNDLLKDFEQSLLTDGLLSDVRIVVPVKGDDECGEKSEEDGKKLRTEEYHAHKNILSARSEVFKAMFAEGSEFMEAKTGVVRIENFSHAGTVQSLLSFIYTGKIQEFEKKSPSEVIELLSAGEQYQIQSLKNLCSSRLQTLISSENVVEVLAAAELYRADEPLKKKAMRFIRDKRHQVLRPGSSHREALRQLTPETMMELLEVFSEIG